MQNDSQSWKTSFRDVTGIMETQADMRSWELVDLAINQAPRPPQGDYVPIYLGPQMNLAQFVPQSSLSQYHADEVDEWQSFYDAVGGH